MRISPIYKIILIFLLILGGVLRFYNHDWGYGNFFHPDERNIGIAVANLNFENGDFNPNFFAYGSLPIYILYFISEGNFDSALLGGRLFSALISTVSLFLIYKISFKTIQAVLLGNSRITNKGKTITIYSLLITAICAFSPGLLQFAHFTTFETFLTFEYLVFTLLAINTLDKPTYKNYILLGIVTGISIGTKIVSLFLLGIFLLIHVIIAFKKKDPETRKLKYLQQLFFRLLNPRIFTSLFFVAVTFFLSNPFVILDYKSFLDSLNYESSGARGTLLVFYNQQFIDTIPFLYQLIYVFPSLVGWPITVLGFLSFLYLLVYSVLNLFKYIFKNTKKPKLVILIPVLVALGYSVLHFYMFVKWSRYVVPLIPFLVIFFVVLLLQISTLLKNFATKLFVTFIFIVSVFSIIQGLNFFTIYLKPDPRIEAAQWLRENSDPEDTFLGEVYDMGMTAFNQQLGSGRITEMNYYEIDDEINDSEEIQKINDLIYQSDFIIVPAERIYPTRFRLKDEFPNGYKHYKNLIEGEYEYEKVAQFTRTTFLEDLFDINFYNGGYFQPLNYDETFRVFDQPTITIYKKI